MGVRWLWTVMALAVACADADRGGSSLRGALEALQRRHRGRGQNIPMEPDYEALYEFIPPQTYPEPDYLTDLDEINDKSPKYVVKLLEEKERPIETYEYKVIKKKNSPVSKESAFRERSHMNENARLRDLFTENNENNEIPLQRAENDAEYAIFLKQLWSKYKTNKHPGVSSQGVVKLYKDKIVKKRVPNNWGPIAFKKKRSSVADMQNIAAEYEQVDDNDDQYDYENAEDMGPEEYALLLQPSKDGKLVDSDKDEQYSYDLIEKRSPVSKRSSGPYRLTKRYTQEHKSAASKRSSSGTDPKIIKHLSKIFGDLETIKSPVKRSSDSHDHTHEESHDNHDHGIHEIKPPNIAVHQNHTHEQNATALDDGQTEHVHLHHPGTTGQEIEKSQLNHDVSHPSHDKPIHVKKKSIDWSDYFGIDKRIENSRTIGMNQDRLRKQYFNSFNKEVLYPLNTFRQHNNVKRNYVKAKPEEETDTSNPVVNTAKRNSASNSESKLDNIDKKLRNMEGIIVDEALHYSNIGEELDSKEEQEMKEKLLSRLAAAYSLEKMRKALKEFKQSLQIQKIDSSSKPSAMSTDEPREKRLTLKKEKLESNNIPIFNKVEGKHNDFEDEQGAGHYLNGNYANQFAEGYMGGSGRHKSPIVSSAVTPDSCPVLTTIIQRCESVDLLAGDRGQLFLPLCSLHQICYICGDAPTTTCDLVFLSEADTICEGDMGCQRAARSALMALRELHDNLADDLEGECEANPCLPATLRLNNDWQMAIQR